MRTLVKSITVFALLFASTSSVCAESARSSKPLGFYWGILSDPFCSLTSIGLGYNAFDIGRLTLSYGAAFLPGRTAGLSTSVFGSTMSGGFKLMVPGWNFTPVVGINAAYTSGTIPAGMTLNYQFLGWTSYSNFGFDLQTTGGFNFGFGANYSFVPGAGWVPYLNFGWFFNPGRSSKPADPPQN